MALFKSINNGRKRNLLGEIAASFCVAAALLLGSFSTAFAADTYTISEVSGILDKIAEQLGVTDADELTDSLVEKIAASDSAAAELSATQQDTARLSRRVDRLESRIEKVGAGAAALAALHPMDFDRYDKMSFAAGMGNYRSESAMALGAFYRPDAKTLLSLGGTMGNGENMVNLGFAFALDRMGSRVRPIGLSPARSNATGVAAEEVRQLKQNDVALNKKLEAAEGRLAELARDVERLGKEGPGSQAEIRVQPPGVAFEPAGGSVPGGLLGEIRRLKGENAAIKEKLAAQERQVGELRDGVSKLSARPAPGRATGRGAEAASEAVPGEFARAVGKLKEENVAMHEQLDDAERVIADLQRSIEWLKKRSVSRPGASGTGGADALATAAELLQKENEDMKARVAAAEGRISGLAKNVEELRRKGAPQAEGQAAAGRELAGDVQQLKGSNAALRDKMAAAESRLAALQSKVEAGGAKGGVPKEISDGVQSLKDENILLKQRLNDAEAKIYELQGNMARLTSVVAKLAQRFIGQ